MGKYGKRNSIDTNPLHYGICVLGESGIGKTTLIKEVCEKLVGDEGYLHLDVARERGSDAIEGIISEKVEDYNKLVDIVDDIVENKETDYPNLQVVIFDTLDEIIPLMEKRAIYEHNKKSPDKKVDSILQVAGGFGRGQDRAMELFLIEMDKLRSVGVNSIIIAHVKRSDMIDPLTQETYSKLTADTQQRYFNAIKNKMHFIALAYIDRSIVQEKTGRKDIKGKDILTNKVTSEARMISFRDDSYTSDSKSRFQNIVDKIPLDCDEFIKAMQDAIIAEKSKSGKSESEIKKEQKARDDAVAKAAKEYSKNAKENKSDPDRNAELITIIQEKFPDATAETKKAIKGIMSTYGFAKFSDDDIPTKVLTEIVELLGE